MTQKWQYQVEQFGSALKATKPQEVEIFLNSAAEQGWELSQTATVSNGNKLLLILRKKIQGRTRRRQSTWP